MVTPYTLMRRRAEVHHETIYIHHNSSAILFISSSIRPVQYYHADHNAPKGCAQNDAVHNIRTTASVLNA